jgi:hypothetical protein
VANSSPSENEPRVVRFRRRGGGVPPPVSTPKGSGGDDDLSPYARSPEDPADYRRRQAVNAAVFLFVVLLIGAAIWLADTLSDMRRNQDCVLSGRRGCTPVEYDRTAR